MTHDGQDTHNDANGEARRVLYALLAGAEGAGRPREARD